MKSKLLIMTVVLACVSLAIAEDGTPDKLQTKTQLRNRLQICDPGLENDCNKLKECLPEEVQDAVQDMTRTREQYQQQLRDKQKDLAECSSEERDQLRERLREQLKDEACDREQLRLRLQEMRECVPTHEEVMDQAREQVEDQTQDRRRGEV